VPPCTPGSRQALVLASASPRRRTLLAGLGLAVEVLADYGGTIARMAADIDGAKDHVHVLFYIFADDPTTAPVVDALERAARRGVRCRVLADAIGSRTGLRTLRPRLTAAGAAVEEALPVSLWPWRKARLDLRNHRKIVVVDGRVGYTGSQNLVAAEFTKGLAYEDLMARVTGPVVLELQYVFASDWFLETGTVLDGDAEFPEPVTTGDVPAQVLPSGPAFPVQNNQRLFVALVHGARERVVLTTPYFVPDEPLLQAMGTAAKRGVEVHLVVSEVGDHPVVARAQESYYEELLEAGVRVHLFAQNFLHAKHLSVDGEVAVIGSSNLDIRSFALNAEVMLMLYDRGVAAALGREEQRTFAGSRELTMASWAARPWRRKLGESLARLLSPLL